jgi:actin-related protein
VNALVFDFGSKLTKIGYAGEDLPKHVFPSSLGYHSTDMQTDQKQPFIGSTEMYHPTPGLEIISPFQDGLIENWDVFEQLWEYSYTKALRTVSSEHPVLFCDPSWDPKENREKLCELAFEKFGVPGFYLGRSAVMSAFAAGRATALVIDSGASHTSVVPVYDGYVIKKGMLLLIKSYSKIIYRRGLCYPSSETISEPFKGRSYTKLVDST